MESVFYYGTNLKNLQLDNSFVSRYKVPVVFLSSNILLAENFAIEQRKIRGKGFLYKIKVIGKPRIEFYNAVTYSAHFRNKIFSIIKTGQEYVILKNCHDRPNETYLFENADIAVLSDFEKVKSIELLKEF